MTKANTKMNVAAIKDSKLTQCMAIAGFSLVIHHHYHRHSVGNEQTTERMNEWGCMYMENVHSISHCSNECHVGFHCFMQWLFLSQMFLCFSVFFFRLVCCFVDSKHYVPWKLSFETKDLLTQLIRNETKRIIWNEDNKQQQQQQH